MIDSGTPASSDATGATHVDTASREELLATVSALRAEVARLKDELRQLRRDQHEVPPHYL